MSGPRLGLVARCDQGGLANQTWDLWRHLHPDVTLVVELNGQGTDDRGKYDGGAGAVHYVQGPALPDAAFAVFRDCDVVLSCETFYHRAEYGPLDDMGVRTMASVNPELRSQRIALTEVLPTPWEHQRNPHMEILPHPVATDLLHRAEQRTAATTFYHPSAPAMLDRNGSALVHAALHDVTEPCDVIVRGNVGGTARVGHVQLRNVAGRTDNYWDAYPDDADVLLLPRRYAGLCLPAQECAALGMPVVCLDTSPLNELPFALSVPARVFRDAHMKGGMFDVHTCHAHDLAMAIDRIVADAGLYRDLSMAALQWAHEHSWEALLPKWRNVIAEAASA